MLAFGAAHGQREKQRQVSTCFVRMRPFSLSELNLDDDSIDLEENPTLCNCGWEKCPFSGPSRVSVHCSIYILEIS